MFGKNPIRKQELGDGHTLWVQDVFHTIQGEGPFAGRPAIFIRLGGCNLNCSWCDTDFESSKWYPSVDEIFAKVMEVHKPNTALVVLTGGEPFRQNIIPLIKALNDDYGHVQIETNGTLWIDDPELDLCSIVCSPKTGKVHEQISAHACAWKYIIRSGETADLDGLPNRLACTGKEALVARPPTSTFVHKRSTIYVQPMDENDPDKNFYNTEAAVHIAMEHGYTLCLQTHKIIGLP